MPTNGPREPSADMRFAAGALREMFIALLNEGFTEDQALAIIGHIMTARMPDS